MRPVILSRPEKLAFLLVTLVRRRLGHHLVARLQASPAIAARPWAGAGPAAPGAGARRRVGDARTGPAAAAQPRCPAAVSWGTTVVPGGGASGCDCTVPGGGTPCPGGGRFGVGNRRPRGSSGTSSSSSGMLLLLLIAAGNGARRPQRRIGKDIADLRPRRRRKRDRRGGDQGRKTGQGNGSKHLAALTGESGSRHSTDFSAARVPPVNTANTAGKGRFAPLPPHSIMAREGRNRLR